MKYSKITTLNLWLVCGIICGCRGKPAWNLDSYGVYRGPDGATLEIENTNSSRVAAQVRLEKFLAYQGTGDLVSVDTENLLATSGTKRRELRGFLGKGKAMYVSLSAPAGANISQLLREFPDERLSALAPSISADQKAFGRVARTASTQSDWRGCKLPPTWFNMAEALGSPPEITLDVYIKKGSKTTVSLDMISSKGISSWLQRKKFVLAGPGHARRINTKSGAFKGVLYPTESSFISITVDGNSDALTKEDVLNLASQLLASQAPCKISPEPTAAWENALKVSRGKY